MSMSRVSSLRRSRSADFGREALAGQGRDMGFFWVSIECSFLKNLFTWLHQVLVAALGIFSCGMWDLVP